MTPSSDVNVSQFAFVAREWPDVFDAAERAEGAVHADPRTACSAARLRR